MVTRTDNTKLCVDCGLKYRTHKTCCRECSCTRSRLYEKTTKGYLVRTYRNMYNRVNGLPKGKAHLYKGLPICDKQEFYEWSLREDSIFGLMLEEYKLSGYDMAFAPSIDRIVTADGYVLGNIQWLTHSNNSSKTNKNNNPELPVGIGKMKNHYTVSKYLKGVHYSKNFKLLKDAEMYLNILCL